MEIKTGIIGIGNAGGQVAALAKENGFDALAINVSEDDTKTLHGVQSMVIGNQMGSGKNRNAAKAYGKESIKEIIGREEFVQFITGKQIVFIAYSLGGGSGSGLGPMMGAVLSNIYHDDDPAKCIRFISQAVVPSLSESVRSQKNVMDALSELTRYNSTYMLYDNEHYSDLPMDKMFNAVNSDIVEDMKVIRGDYNILSQYSMIDQQDMLNIVSFAGMFRIASAVGFVSKDLDKESIEDKLIKNILDGAGCELDRDKIVKVMGTIVNLRDDVSEGFDSSLPKLRASVGEPAVDFNHYYVIGEDEDAFKNRVHVMLGGLSTPDDRLKKIVERIKEAEAALTKTKASSVLASYSESTSFVDGVNDTSSKATKNIDDILGSF